MRLILVGCEYSGTTTLSEAISEWAKEVMGGGFRFHDHWKVPHVSHPPGLTAEEQEQFLALSPNLKEMFQRYHMEYHLSPSFYGDPHHNSVGFHIDEAVYAPLYYGYGGAGEYGDRVRTARRTEDQAGARELTSGLGQTSRLGGLQGLLTGELDRLAANFSPSHRPLGPGLSFGAPNAGIASGTHRIANFNFSNAS